MGRNKQLLTDKENERMFADIVENVVGVKIELNYTNMPDCNVGTYMDLEKQMYYTITLGKIKGVNRFTLLNHEAGHILADSPTKAGEAMITEWAKEWKADAFVSLDTLKYTYWYALNLIEDQRIESFMSKLYLNNKKRFYKAKVIVGREYNNHSLREKRVDWIVNPLLALEFVRFLRNDIMECEHGSKATLDRGYCVCAGKECFSMAKKILNEVEGTGQTGALLGLKMFKPFIDEYIDSMIKAGHNWKPDLSNWGTPPDYTERNTVILDMDNEPFNKSFADALHDGEKHVQEIQAKLSGIINMNNSTHDVIEDDGDVCIGIGKPVQEIADGMSKIFRKLREIPKETIGYDGDEIDIESYITNKAEEDDIGKCFIDTKHVNGISILVSVDGSSSMEDSYDGGYSSMDCARDMVATMYKAIEGIDNVNLKSIVWAGNIMGIMNVTTINSIRETSKIRIASGYPTTPTHLAIDYSTKMIKRMKGRKKLLIFITDGQPEYVKNGMFLPPEMLVKMCSNSMTRGLRRCNSIMAMLIKPDDSSKKCCDDIFGKRLMTVDNMKSGSDIIMNKFKRLVMGVLK